MDTPGYHPVQNPNPDPLSTEDLGFKPSIPPPVPAPATFPVNRNQQGLCGFTIPTGRGPAWEQQLRDMLQAQYQGNQPAQQASPPLALEEQDPSGSTQRRRSSRVQQPASTHPDDVYGSLDPVSCQQMDLRHGLANLPAENPARAVQEENTVAPEPLSEDPSEDYGLEYAPETAGVATTISYMGQKTLTQLCQEGGVPLINFLLALAMPSHEQSTLPSTQSVQDWHFQDILRLPTREREEWKKACLEELKSLRAQKVFKLTDLPKGRKVIKNRWVFDIKQDGRKKAHLVAKGFSQVEEIDFNEIFSPVVLFETVRLMLALSSLEDWYIEALDVKTAFLYGKLDEEIYMHQPEGFKLKGQENKVLCLHCALYGLKQSCSFMVERAGSFKEKIRFWTYDVRCRWVLH